MNGWYKKINEYKSIIQSVKIKHKSSKWLLFAGAGGAPKPGIGVTPPVTPRTGAASTKSVNPM